MLNSYMNKKITRKYLWIGALIIPECLQLFGAPEIRFFILINFLVFFAAVILFDYKIITHQKKEKVISGAVICVVIAILWIAVYSNIISDTRGQVMLINDSSERYEEYREGIWGE